MCIRSVNVRACKLSDDDSVAVPLIITLLMLLMKRRVKAPVTHCPVPCKERPNTRITHVKRFLGGTCVLILNTNIVIILKIFLRSCVLAIMFNQIARCGGHDKQHIMRSTNISLLYTTSTVHLHYFSIPFHSIAACVHNVRQETSTALGV